MRSAEHHAARHGLHLPVQGPRPMCGAASTTGYDGCLADAARLSELVDFAEERNRLTRFLSVDAMALQRSEVHGPGNNHLHVAHLQLVLVDGLVWRYSFTPLLSAATDAYARDHLPDLSAPSARRRGGITVLGLPEHSEASAATDFVRRWAMVVLGACGPTAVKTVRTIVHDFRRRLDGLGSDRS